MSFTIPPSVRPVHSPNPPTAATPSPGRSPSPNQAPDRVESSAPSHLGALLTVGTLAAAQVIPGVVEAEGAIGIGTALAIGARSLLVNPAVRAVAAYGVAKAADYGATLVHDATAGQPLLKTITDAGAHLNAAVHTSLGIPQPETP